MEKQNVSSIQGVMLNAYPDSVGTQLNDVLTLLQHPDLENVFSLFYILPTFFNSDLDRGFSIIDYELNSELVSKTDLKALEALNIQLKFDIVLNHLSVASPQFKDLLEKGEQSQFKDFFIHWNHFWEGNGTLNNDGILLPREALLNKLFMRKAGLPVLKVPFPDGSEQPYWNTFYQDINYNPLPNDALDKIEGISTKQAETLREKINTAIAENRDISQLDFEDFEALKPSILEVVNQHRSYLGQMDVNAQSPMVWDFYRETLQKIEEYGGSIVRLDAFAYLHKQVGQSNFFNEPGTWDYLERIEKIATQNALTILPEIHAEYGLHLHDKIAEKGYFIYDFFLPGLTIHTLETGNGKALLRWAKEILHKGYKTVNMLGCHDGIPVLDLKGKTVDGEYHQGLLDDQEIAAVMDTIMARGGRVKNLYDPSGKKISYYQINATFFSALGEDENKLILARALQLFMPGIPQIWYLDLFMGKNDYAAADQGGSGNHKEINRTSLSLKQVKEGLKKKGVRKQLEMMRLRNTSKAFLGQLSILETSDAKINMEWSNQNEKAHLIADLKSHRFTIQHTQNGVVKVIESH